MDSLGRPQCVITHVRLDIAQLYVVVRLTFVGVDIDVAGCRHGRLPFSLSRQRRTEPMYRLLVPSPDCLPASPPSHTVARQRTCTVYSPPTSPPSLTALTQVTEAVAVKYPKVVGRHS